MPVDIQGRKANRLIRERSPYLLQHAYNPVDWFPWSAEALAKARQEDKPIFLSIGYSTCYWCHVMEQESFENPVVAELINASFVPIKVDREERPDIDAIYMTAVQAISGQGGWPMTVFLTPEGKPFWGGTYFPPESKWGRPGLTDVLRSVADAWRTRRSELLESSESITAAMQAAARSGPPGALIQDVLQAASAEFASQYDPVHGGFGQAPKFPRSHALSLLLRFWSSDRDAHTLQMVESTLDAMARGGLHDQVGGGFHRYSTDAQWLVPHFEKMLYDQALLARTYLEAYQATGKADYAAVARDIFEYVLRDLRDAGGAFYCAEDAGEVGKEGEFYVWTPAQFEQVLGAERAARIGRFYGVTPEGHFEHGASILHIEQPDEVYAYTHGFDAARFADELVSARAALLAARSRRPRPHRDEKILTDWNGLMIGALAYAGRALQEPRYTQAAQDAADALLRQHQRSGRLLHQAAHQTAELPAFLDDYAFLVEGLFELYETTFDARWLGEAVRLTKDMMQLFWDAEGGGFLLSGARHEPLIAKTKELYDGALPSGNSVATLNLVRFGALTQDREVSQRAEQQFGIFADAVHRMPTAFPEFLIALDLWLGPVQEIVIAGDKEAESTQRMLQVVQQSFLPRAVVAWHPGASARDLEALAPWLSGHVPVNGQATAYVCQNAVCSLPTTDLDRLKVQLGVR